VQAATSGSPPPVELLELDVPADDEVRPVPQPLVIEHVLVDEGIG
jgi:hypothetical protein